MLAVAYGADKNHRSETHRNARSAQYGKISANQKISEVHGKALRREIPEIGKRVFYTLYHPAAALYNGSMREVLIKDFKRIPKVLEKIKEEN